jgi:hypothetical protein
MTSELRAATAAYRRAERRAEDLRSKLAAAIVAADAAGVRQVDIVEITGYTRERVRQILRAAHDARSDDSPDHTTS